MQIKKILTHNGQFHADEVFACALIQCVFGEHIPIVRTRDITIDDMNDPETWIVDMGGVHNPELGLFDHHHDRILSASNCLVLEHLHYQKIIHDDLFWKLYDNFRNISNIDCNGYEGFDGFQVNSLIKSFNSLENGFDIALDVAKSYIKAKMIDCVVAEQSRQIFDSGERLSEGVRICDKFPVFWKSYEECEFLVAPDQNAKWCLHSRDSREFPILSTGEEEFIHNQKFIAVYPSMEKAMDSGRYQSHMYFG